MRPLSPKEFQRRLLTWFDQYGRKNLPWQKNKTPYWVWVSEIMLQQTQVKTVIPYFNRFVTEFKNIKALANAHEDQVLHRWSGLGYYQRARNLHKTAKIILEEFQAEFPHSQEIIEQLPGIGRSTAAAILSIAFNKKATILDGNVKRVFTRLFNLEEWPGDKKVTERLWQLAEQYTPRNHSANYTQAIMDLGATLCKRNKPECPICPVKSACLAHAKGTQNTLPLPKPQKILPRREVTFLIFCRNEKILLEKRPSQGIWASLWSFPEMSHPPQLDELSTYCKKHYAFSLKNYRMLDPLKHSFTHFHLKIQPILISVKRAKPASKLVDLPYIWYNFKHAVQVGMPAPTQQLINRLKQAKIS